MVEEKQPNEAQMLILCESLIAVHDVDMLDLMQRSRLKQELGGFIVQIPQSFSAL